MTVESFSSVQRRNFRINRSAIPEIVEREHMARPYPGGNFDILFINVPSTFQQGLIPDGEELPHGVLRTLAAARHLHERMPAMPRVNAGILDAHRLRLMPGQIAEQIIKTGAKSVGLNPTSVNVVEAQAIAQMCDELGVPYILGGIHATLDTEIAHKDFPTAAAIVKGNGEFVIAPLVKGLIEGKNAPIIGVRYPNSLQTIGDFYAPVLNPDQIPLVDQLLYAEEPIYRHEVGINGTTKTIREANLFVTYGCPFECTFCSSPVMVNRGGKDHEKNSMRPYDRPEMDRIITEIQHVVNDLDADAIHFLDDMAFVTPAHIDDLHAGLKSSDLMNKFIWRGLTRAPVINRFSDATMEKLVETGAWKIALGVESGNDQMLEQIKKKVTTDDVKKAVTRLSEYGIQAKGFFIFGFPGETEAQMQDTLNLIQDLKVRGMTEIAAFQFKPYPGTQEYSALMASQPSILSRLSYLRRANMSTNGKVDFRASQHDTWLPDDLVIAEVPSGVVRQYVIQGLEEFYGPDAHLHHELDPTCV